MRPPEDLADFVLAGTMAMGGLIALAAALVVILAVTAWAWGKVRTITDRLDGGR